MSQDLLRAARSLADAIKIHREYVSIFEDCPKDHIDEALEDFEKEWVKYRTEWEQKSR